MLSVQQFFRLFGGHGQVDGPHRLVGVLSALFGRVKIGLFGRVLVAIYFADTGERALLRLGGDTHGVRSHIGDKRDMVSVFRLDALVEMLGEAHGLGRGKAQLVGGILLHRAGGKRRGRMRFRNRLFHLGDDIFSLFQLL